MLHKFDVDIPQHEWEQTYMDIPLKSSTIKAPKRAALIAGRSMHFIADETVLFNNDSALLPLGLFLEAESYFSGCWVVQGDDMGGEILVAAGADHDMVVEPTSGPDDTMGYSGGGSGWLRSRPDLGDWNLTFPDGTQYSHSVALEH